ncbi:3358_t:CDS:2 [Acaulospora morrowiae]|uniref:3358_t:CDS:1 n=1 Tax=Acaulospora morrowiae TaxID=94023 RepID=A0A9N9BFP4_9GLOM|nr:3358_t:CDS:2 [Acaulospora morrowiae]
MSSAKNIRLDLRVPKIILWPIKLLFFFFDRAYGLEGLTDRSRKRYCRGNDDSRFRQTKKTGYPESNLNTYQLEALNTVLRYQSQGLEQQKVTDLSTLAFFPRSQPERELTNELNVAIIMPGSPFSRSSFRCVKSENNIRCFTFIRLENTSSTFFANIRNKMIDVNVKNTYDSR